MPVNGVEIKVGQVWRTRGGSLAEVVSKEDHPEFPWDIEVSDCGDPAMRSCCDSGRIWGVGYDDSDGDLLFLVSDPEIGTERRQQQVPNAPLRRKDDMIPVPDTVPDLAASPADFVASVPGAMGEPISLAQERTTKFIPELVLFSTPTSALDVQIGGSHYRSMAIQPVTYIESNGLDFLAGNVVKYVSRHKSKNGAADVRKAIHYCQLILELQYGEKS